MSGEVMYSLKPLTTSNLTIKNENVCMYEMKNIHRGCEPICNSSDDVNASKFCNNVEDITQKVINFLKNPLPEVALLEARQEKILSQLAELKEQVLGLCDVLKTDNDSQKISPSTTTTTTIKREPIVVHLIVKADPRKPCWTLRALCSVWRDVNFVIKTYRHSSVEENIPDFAIDCKKEFTDTIKVDLIWKRVDDTEFIISEFNGYTLIGETNFLRYLARQLSNEKYEKLSNQRDIGRIEMILDMSHRLSYEESTKSAQSLLSMMGEKLEKKQNWYSNDENPDFVDIAAWSAVKQASITKLPCNLNLWFERCENIFLK